MVRNRRVPRKTMNSFFSSELEKALEEQSFGIAGFQLLQSSNSLESSALVTLLEGIIVNISVSSRGYQVWRYFSFIFYFLLTNLS
jgi:hypothetical protein